MMQRSGMEKVGVVQGNQQSRGVVKAADENKSAVGYEAVNTERRSGIQLSLKKSKLHGVHDGI